MSDKKDRDERIAGIERSFEAAAGDVEWDQIPWLIEELRKEEQENERLRAVPPRRVAKEPTCAPLPHEFTRPTISEPKIGRQRYTHATSICVKCGKTKTWAA